MITTNAIQRTFHIKRSDASGTAFAIDRASRQYLVTARHVVDGITSVPNGLPQTELRMAGVVANYPTPLREPIVDKRGNPIVDDHNEPAAFFSENPGFVVAMAISHATGLIDANPVGFQLPTK